MTDDLDRRDFFISFNSADKAYAEAIDAALRKEGFTTFYDPRDLKLGGNVPMWMDDALINSAQTLALYSPDYTKDPAVYSRVERYATCWQDPLSDKRKLIPVLLRETTFTPLMAMVSRIEAVGKTPQEAAAILIERLRDPNETEQRDHCHRFGGQYSGVWWIRAEQVSVLLSDLKALGQKLGLEEKQNVEEAAKDCLAYLANQTQPFLLVYDNAPNPDGVRKHLPHGATRCIITSRFTEFGDMAPVTRLDKWYDSAPFSRPTASISPC